jgi:hypothetical protein
MTTWMQVMAFVRRLDEQRRRDGHVTPSDADELVTMLLDFHKQTVAHSASSAEMAPVVPPQPDDSARRS